MGTCFVIQPFNEEFNKRYDTTLKDAINKTNLTPYRADRDPKANIPIETIHAEIESAHVCLADISEDNPNVWYELGYAIANHGHEKVILICCSDKRSSQNYPFDVRHLRIIEYVKDSNKDFDDLGKKITDRLKAILEAILDKEEVKSDTHAKTIDQAKPMTNSRELDLEEIDTLNTIMDVAYGATGGVRPSEIYRRMKQHGYSQTDINTALAGLEDREIIELYEEGTTELNTFVLYRVTRSGRTWISQNKDKLKSEKEDPESEIDDEIPF